MSFKKISRYLELLPEIYGIPFSELSVFKENERVYRHSVGDLPYGTKTMYRLYSMTKLSTVTATMQLVERGKIGIDDEVSKYLPEYKNVTVGNDCTPAKNAITIRHLLSMRSGIGAGKNVTALEKARKNPDLTTREMVDAIAQSPLMFEPGTDWLYGYSHDVLGAVIEVVSGMRFGEYLEKNIFAPLEMSDTTFFLSEDEKCRLAPLYTFMCDTYTCCEVEHPQPLYMLSKKLEFGGGGLFSTHDEYAKLPKTIANGGLAQNGYRLLKEETINMIKQNQMPAGEQHEFARMKPGYGYGLGVRTLVDRVDANGPAPIGEFGWDGAAASYFMIDTENKLSAIWTTHVLDCRPAYREIHPHIRNLVYEACKE